MFHSKVLFSHVSDSLKDLSLLQELLLPAKQNKVSAKYTSTNSISLRSMLVEVTVVFKRNVGASWFYNVSDKSSLQESL